MRLSFLSQVMVLRCVASITFEGDLEEFRVSAVSLRDRLREGQLVRSPSPIDEIRFSPLSTLEYPKGDYEKLKRLAELWELYYDCLAVQYKAIGLSRFLHPIAISVYERGTIHLECIFCVSPQDASNQVQWFHKRSGRETGVEVTESEHRFISFDDTLNIYLVTKEDAGIYYCKSGDTGPQSYYVHVFGDEEPVIQVRRNLSNGPLPDDDEELTSDYTITTVWSDWNTCSHCGSVGRRSRFGSCMVKVNREDENLKLGGDEMNIVILRVFLFGLPCRSQLLPEMISNNELVQTRPNEIMIGYCKTECSDTIFEITNENGDLLGLANNTDGVFSPFQAPPRLPPSIGRATIFAEIGQTLKIHCPGSNNIDAPYEWYINDSVKILREVVNKHGSEKISIDPRERLVFERVEGFDTYLFTCRQGESIAGVVRLVPIETYYIEVDQHFLLIGVILILLIFCYLTARITSTKEKARSARHYQSR